MDISDLSHACDILNRSHILLSITKL